MASSNGTDDLQTTLSKFLRINDSVNSSSSSVSHLIRDEEPPIFSKRKMLLRIPEQYSGNIMQLTVSKNWMFCLLTGPPQITLLRFFLLRAMPPSEIDLEKYLAGYKVSKMFADHTGHHLLISIVPKSPGLSADFLYIHGNGPKVRRIEKFKDHEITAVAFNSYMGTESSTGPILLGTSRGLIFETELLQEGDRPLYRKQVYDLGLGRQKYPITSLELLRGRSSNVCVVLASAIDCIYTFQETFKTEDKFSIQAIFTAYVSGLRLPHTIKEVSDLHYSVLRCFAQPNEKYPTQWGWMCGAGVRNGVIAFDDTDESILRGDDLVSVGFEEKKHLSYEGRRLFIPKTFILTEYHVLLLYSDHVTGICLLNHEVVYEEYFSEKMGKLLNILRDPFSGSIYVYTEKNVFNYKITNEQRNMWDIYLQKGNFDMAELYASGNPEHLNIVLTRKADKAFDDENHNLAAQVYAETQKTFEEICLKFMNLNDKQPLINYISRRLDKLQDDDIEQFTALTLWLIDIYMTQINLPNRSAAERQIWQQTYDNFISLPRVSRCISTNYAVIYDLIAEHADAANLSKLAVTNQDYEAVISQHFNCKQYNEALQTMATQKDPELFYKYCPMLMVEIPKETVEVLKCRGRKLQIERLVPALITIDSPVHIEEIIKYLEYAIYNLGEGNQAVHNYLLRLYAEKKPDKLMTYLENEGHDVSLVHYEINYALSVCMEFGARKASVFLQCLLEMWPAAVELALSFDLELAKETASKPKDEELRRKLWLGIAYHDIKGKIDVGRALQMLQECELLRIEDLLPLFSDFEKIDDFKKPICLALKEYNQKIQELQHDMEEYSKQADRVRNDLQSIRERSIRIEAHEPCAMCESYLLVKPFFVFPCGHKFHSDCLEKHVTPMLSSDKSRKLTKLKQQMESLLTQSAAMAGQSSNQQIIREKIKCEAEKILASGCFYCEHMIETIDQPFCEDWDQVNVDWE